MMYGTFSHPKKTYDYKYRTIVSKILKFAKKLLACMCISKESDETEEEELYVDAQSYVVNYSQGCHMFCPI